MVNMKKSLTALVVGVALAAGSIQALAHKEGDFILRVGAAHVNPNDESSNVLGTDDGVTVDSATGLGFSGTWMLTDNWGFEVLAALPFEHDIDGNGSLSGLPIGSTKHLPPTASFQYYPDVGGDSFHPYFGLGVNYTYFFDEEVSPELKAALGTNDVELSLDSSIGIAGQIGADWKIGDNWFINTGVWYVDINTDADVIVNGATATTVDVDIDPWVAMVGFAWRF
ncbi:OmpW family protein [Kangiella sediminilitoris]|uniref:OmpW family protein n=2 Tax=Kangiella sediminilitoris TaxID=1144748 RepID=A0A1B3B9E2_9GAMM|nr:OmpW family protein [Kangiella sediminilitoris]